MCGFETTTNLKFSLVYQSFIYSRTDALVSCFNKNQY